MIMPHCCVIGAVGDHVEDEAQRLDLRAHPAQVRDHDAERGQHLHRPAVALAVVVADGEQVHAVERAGEEEAHQDQAQARAERVGDDPREAVLDEGRRDAEHRLGAEPGREHRGGHDVHRHAPPGDREVLGVVHPLRRVDADRDRDDPVDDHEPEEHGRPAGGKWAAAILVQTSFAGVGGAQQAFFAQDGARDVEAVLEAVFGVGAKFIAKYAVGRPLRSIQPTHHAIGVRSG